jgi:protein-S-isoprenylcysteine O-methyltransferase Ste14
MTYRILSIFATIALIISVLVLFWCDILITPSPVVITLQILAIALMIWARRTFGMRSFHAAANPTEGGLVTHGPYHYIRHPIYAAVLLLTLPAVMANPSLLSLGMGMVIIAGTWTRILCEEHLLIERYPEYRDYASKTRRIIPYIL